MANSVDTDETPHSAASHLGLYCLLRPVCPNTYGKYGNVYYHGDIKMFWFREPSYLQLWLMSKEM